MKQIPVSTLKGPLLAEFVARARGWVKRGNRYYPVGIDIEDYRPDINGGQAMELVNKFEVRLMCEDSKEWWAEIRLFDNGKLAYCTSFDKAAIGKGDTPEIAICRAAVASKFGEYVVVDNDGAAEVEG